MCLEIISGVIMKSKLKNFSLLTISTLIMAVGIYFFKFANNFTFGGITGMAVYYWLYNTWT